MLRHPRTSPSPTELLDSRVLSLVLSRQTCSMLADTRLVGWDTSHDLKGFSLTLNPAEGGITQVLT